MYSKTRPTASPARAPTALGRGSWSPPTFRPPPKRRPDARSVWSSEYPRRVAAIRPEDRVLHLEGFGSPRRGLVPFGSANDPKNLRTWSQDRTAPAWRSRRQVSMASDDRSDDRELTDRSNGDAFRALAATSRTCASERMSLGVRGRGSESLVELFERRSRPGRPAPTWRSGDRADARRALPPRLRLRAHFFQSDEALRRRVEREPDAAEPAKRSFFAEKWSTRRSRGRNLQVASRGGAAAPLLGASARESTES